MESSTPVYQPPRPTGNRQRPCGVCSGLGEFPGKGGEAVPCSFCQPTPPERICQKCQRPFSLRDQRRGRGRQHGEHPEHVYAPCGHSITYFGYRLTAWGCQAEIVRVVARMEEATLAEIAGLRVITAEALPFSLGAEYAALARENEAWAQGWLLWAVTERLRDLADQVDDAELAVAA